MILYTSSVVAVAHYVRIFLQALSATYTVEAISTMTTRQTTSLQGVTAD